jgi:hypothetical protein
MLLLNESKSGLNPSASNAWFITKIYRHRGQKKKYIIINPNPGAE